MQISDLNKANAPHSRMIDDFLLNCWIQLQKRRSSMEFLSQKFSFDASKLSRFV